MGLRKMICRLGVFDIPIIQMQPPFMVDLLDSNIIVFGSAMSGKTTFLRTLVNILHKAYSHKQEQIFVLDFGGALFDLAEMPLVSAYFDNSNEEYVKRVFKILESILKDNLDRLSGKNYRDSEVDLPHTTFIIDNLNAFLDEPRYMSYQEKLAKLCREGLSKGITIVVTASETKGTSSYMGSFKQKIAYEMQQDKYMEIFGNKVGMIGNNPGHGFANVTVKPDGITGTFRMNLPYEVQSFLPYGTDKDAENLFENRLKDKFGFAEGCYKHHVKKYQTFPKELTEIEFAGLNQNPLVELTDNSVSVGLDYVDFKSVDVNYEKLHTIAIYGKKEFGKTNLLTLLAKRIIEQRKDVRFVLFDDGRNQLQPIYDMVCKEVDAVLINQYKEVELLLNDETSKIRKLSPLQQFYVYLNQNYATLDKRFLAGIYGLSKEFAKEYAKIPDCENEKQPFTIFVLQSKLLYLNTIENKFFINVILPQMVAVAEENGFCFIFSDVQKISDSEQNMYFNNALQTAFLLDNIAEFAGERGQKTIFGNMDIKTLKEDYARCELGDGYFYDIEADRLSKLKFIKV